MAYVLYPPPEFHVAAPLWHAMLQSNKGITICGRTEFLNFSHIKPSLCNYAILQGPHLHNELLLLLMILLIFFP